MKTVEQVEHDRCRVKTLGRLVSAAWIGCVCVAVAIGHNAWSMAQRSPKTTRAAGPVMPPARASTIIHAEPMNTTRAATVLSGSVVLEAASVTNVTTVTSPPYKKNGSIKLAWNRSPDPQVVGYRIRFGVTSGVYTNSATVGNITNCTVVDLEEGVRYYFAAYSIAASGVESLPSNEASGFTGFHIGVRQASWVIETYGRAGATNEIQRSTNLVNWTTVKTFLGIPGMLTNVIEPDFPHAYYRVRVKP